MSAGTLTILTVGFRAFLQYRHGNFGMVHPYSFRNYELPYFGAVQ
jgi:hypothetical protein